LGITSSGTITLFDEYRFPAHRPVTFIVSLALHGVGGGLIFLGILTSPKLQDPTIAHHYTVRHLDLHTPDGVTEKMRGIRYPNQHSLAKAATGGEQPAAHAPVLHQISKADQARQTLVQPDLPEHLKIAEETPIPAMVIWTPPKVHVKEIVAPKPAELASSDVKPSLVPPNEELSLAEVGISSSPLALKPQPIPASTTSPVVLHAPDAPQLPPVTATQTAQQPTATAILSISDVKLEDGSVNLPPANTSAASKTSDPPSLGQSKDASKPSNGKSDAKAAGKGEGQQAAKKAAEGAGKGPAKAQPAPVKQSVPAKQSAPHPSNQAGASVQELDPQHTQIKRPADGRFGAVIVGSSLEEQYPEIGAQWQGRLAYTVNLHVGTAKNWILQYSAPRAEVAAAAGNLAHLDAPWPYSIVRPNLAPGAINADALMVHGFVNKEGRFEELAVAFPPEFPQAQFVLNSLAQWIFRPAAQNGQPARVEILLIIPDTPE
jgi:hypothetical protein